MGDSTNERTGDVQPRRVFPADGFWAVGQGQPIPGVEDERYERGDSHPETSGAGLHGPPGSVSGLGAFAPGAEQPSGVVPEYPEYEMVADTDPKTGEVRFYLPSRYRAMAAARRRVEKKRALRRSLAERGITDVTIV